MALIDFHTYRHLNKSLDRIALALERIADTMEGHLRKRVFAQAGAADDAELLMQSDADFAEIEELENRLSRSRGVEPGPDEDIVAQLQDAKDGRP